MSDNIQKLKEICESVVEQHEMMFIEFVVRGEGRVKIVELFIDGEDGVTADVCAAVSRDISKITEEMELFEGPYRLDVSSPGVSRPLVFLKQYTKHTGRIFEVSYLEEEAVKKLKGKLLSIENEDLTFEINNEPKTLAFSQIKSARVKVSF